MTRSNLSQPAPKSASEYKAAIEQIFQTMERIDERIAKDQQEIDRLKAETRAILTELRKQSSLT
jgi:uncharacterized small protein (DUF1192 family)